jgi:hypothetical protein
MMILNDKSLTACAMFCKKWSGGDINKRIQIGFDLWDLIQYIVRVERLEKREQK